MESMKNTSENTPFLVAVKDLFDGVAAGIPDGSPKIKAYIAGGTAVHWWLRSRSTDDVDASFSHKLIMAGDAVVYYEDENGRHAVELDRQYNPTFGLEHETTQERAVSAMGLLGGGDKIDVFILAPVDIVLSKLARWAEVDQDDARDLGAAGLVDPDELAALAEDAMLSAVGVNPRMLQHNLNDAIEYARQATPKRNPSPRP